MSKYQLYIDSTANAGRNGEKEFGTHTGIIELSKLLVKLAEDTEKTTQQNLQLQERVANLTRWILAPTALFLGISIFQVVYQNRDAKPEINHTNTQHEVGP